MQLLFVRLWQRLLLLLMNDMVDANIPSVLLTLLPPPSNPNIILRMHKLGNILLGNWKRLLEQSLYCLDNNLNIFNRQNVHTCWLCEFVNTLWSVRDLIWLLTILWCLWITNCMQCVYALVLRCLNKCC